MLRRGEIWPSRFNLTWDTFAPLYVQPCLGLRSFGCWQWSESLSSQMTLLGDFPLPMLTDTHLFSKRHQCSHPSFPTVRFINTCPSKYRPHCTGRRCMVRREQSMNDDTSHWRLSCEMLQFYTNKLGNLQTSLTAEGHKYCRKVK